MVKMKRYSLNFILFISILVFLFFSTNAFAVGIGHGDTTVHFQPNLEVTIPFILRNIKSGTYIELSVTGELKDYVTLSELSPTGELNVTVHLPDKIEKPGTHTIWILAKEIPNATMGTIAAVTAVQVPIPIIVPYPGKYVEVRLDAPDVNIGESVNFVISVTNRGEQNIIAKGTIEIYNPNNEKIATVYTEERAIKTTMTEELHAQWETSGVKEGEYKAIATITYDGETARAEKTFRIGTLLIKIIDYTREFQKDTINRFDIEVESVWNDKISDVYAEIVISDENKNQISSFKTPSTDVEPWEKKIITAYWDTTDINIGTYDANITLHYASKVTEKIVKVQIREKLIPVTGKVLEVFTSIYTIIVICIIILAFYWYSKRKRMGR